jgi:hypothetical protein
MLDDILSANGGSSNRAGKVATENLTPISLWKTFQEELF